MLNWRVCACLGGFVVKYTPLFLSPLGLIPAGHPALAGDNAALPPNAQPVKFEKFAPAWQGFYAGVHAGVLSARSELSSFTGSGGTIINGCLTNNCAFSQTDNPSSLIGGLQIGYNFQSGAIVYGVEADFSIADAKKDTSVVSVFGYNASTGIDNFGTVRLRLGYAFDNNLMLFGTGGWATAKTRDAVYATSTFVDTYSWVEAKRRNGYTLGGGLEYKFARNLSVKGEALYYNLGTKEGLTNSASGAYSFGVRDKMTGVIARIGLNYLFH